MEKFIVEYYFVGTEEAEIVYGSEKAEYINLLEGDDIYTAIGGPDIVYGGKGNDTVVSYGAESLTYGEEGDDYLVGSKVTFGDNGDDIINNQLVETYEVEAYGGNGNDLMLGSKVKRNEYFGRAGDDTLLGGAVADHFDGGKGEDWIYGEKGNDFIDGGKGDDILVGAEGADFLEGGEGSDEFIFYPVYSRDIDFIHDYEDGVDRIGVTDLENVGWYYDEGIKQTVVVDTEKRLFFTKIGGNVVEQLDRGDFFEV